MAESENDPKLIGSENSMNEIMKKLLNEMYEQSLLTSEDPGSNPTITTLLIGSCRKNEN